MSRSPLAPPPEAGVVAPAAAPAEAAPCGSCGQPHAGRYGPACGERRLRPGDLTLRHFLAESAEALTNLDGRLLGSLRALLTRPGELTAAYVGGRAGRYLRPLQLFLLCNVVFFFAQGIWPTDVLTTTLDSHLHFQPYSEWVHRLLLGGDHAATAAREASPEFQAYRTRFDTVAAQHARTLVIAMVPLFALAVLATFLRSRRSFVEHVVFATHFVAFLLLLLTVVIPLLWAGIQGALALGLDVSAVYRPDDWQRFDRLLILTLLGSVSAYLLLAARRVDRLGWLRGVLATAVLGLGGVAMLGTYRLLLSFTTYLLL